MGLKPQPLPHLLLLLLLIIWLLREVLLLELPQLLDLVTLPVTDTVLELLELLSEVTQTVLSFQLKLPTLLLPEKLLWLLLLLEVMAVLQTHQTLPQVLLD